MTADGAWQQSGGDIRNVRSPPISTVGKVRLRALTGAKCQIYPVAAERRAARHSQGMSNCPDQTPRRAARAWSSART